MELITWNKSFETGHPIVDGQHKNLFSMVNHLHTAIEEGHAKLILIETMEKLASYVAIHFKTEEELMQASNYPEYEIHKTEHENLKEQAFKLIKLFSLGKVDLTATISKFLSDWLQHHILEVDIKMISWVKEKDKEHAES
jgi:hemerythrin